MKILVLFNFVDKSFLKKTYPKSVHSVLILTGGHIGDIIRLLPAVRSIYSLFPNASFTILSKLNNDFFKYFPEHRFITQYIYYNPEKEHKSLISKLNLIRTLRKRKFELFYAPARGVGMFEISIFAALVGAHYRIGFKQKGHFTFNNIYMEFQQNLPILKQNLLLLKASGIDNNDETIQIILPKDDIVFAQNLFLNNTHSQIHVSIHPGANWETSFRSWSIENFILIVDNILNFYGERVKIVMLGDQNELLLSKRFPNHLKKKVSFIDMIGKTTLSQMMSIIKHSHIFIGNDSGPLHIARAFKIPTIGIFGPTNPGQVVSDWHDFFPIRSTTTCNSCYLHEQFFKPTCREPICLISISVEKVFRAITKIMERYPEN
jgi:ADP-heptose:LPS heptosyltransferase